MERELLTLEKNGETLRIIRSAAESGGAVTEFEGSDEPGIGPPNHVHYLQEEWLKVIQGRIKVRTADKEFILNTGDEYVFAPGEVHKFWNDGNEKVHYRGSVKPSLNYEYFLRQVYISSNQAKSDKPGPFDAAFLLTRYRSEFDILDIPQPVKKIVFPVLLFIGRLLGKFKKYADAPPPVKELRR
jgi:quercetin dioxygenase-like cupin family protein